jgi:hypothetical protein
MVHFKGVQVVKKTKQKKWSGSGLDAISVEQGIGLHCRQTFAL